MPFRSQQQAKALINDPIIATWTGDYCDGLRAELNDGSSYDFHGIGLEEAIPLLLQETHLPLVHHLPFNEWGSYKNEIIRLSYKHNIKLCA